jgi:hypothetical protein
MSEHIFFIESKREKDMKRRVEGGNEQIKIKMGKSAFFRYDCGNARYRKQASGFILKG